MQDSFTGAALPDARTLHPIILPDGTPHAGTVFLANAIDHPNIAVGDWSYASDNAPPEDWAAHLAPYLYSGAPEHLTIGKFCQIAMGARFVTASANHARDGISTFPFPVFTRDGIATYRVDTRDTIIGHDVWIGAGATILPGVTVGSGAIIGARAVVRRDVPPYSVVAGNPATILRHRFAPPDIARLLEMAWWDWPSLRIAKAQCALMNADLDALETLAP